MNYDNEEAAGGIVTLVFIFLLSAILFIIMSFGVDRLTLIAGSTLVQSASQMRWDTLNVQLILFRLEPLILLLGAGLNYFITESKQQSGVVDLGGMLMAAIEMIAGTFLIMIMSYFGGATLEVVVGVMDAWSFVPQTDLYTVIQYLNVVYYGFMTLIIVSIIALFLLKCAQQVDYASTPSYM